jgi:hypothetical protein
MCPSDGHCIESGLVITWSTCLFFVTVIVPDGGQNKQMKVDVEGKYLCIV